MTDQALLSKEEIQTFLDDVFPEMKTLGDIYEIIDVNNEFTQMRLKYHPANVRPGNSISGPAIMALCDIVMFVGILSHIGKQAFAVTTHFSIDFLNKPEAGDIYAFCYILKQGKRLVVTRVDVYDHSQEKLCAHAVGTYSIPPR